MSPFSPGDILRYRSSSGREVALGAMRNQTYEGLIRTMIDTEFNSPRSTSSSPQNRSFLPPRVAIAPSG